MTHPTTAIRLNPFKGCAGPEGRAVPWSPYGRILDKRPVFTLDPLFHAGCYYVQDSSAMYVGHIFRKILKSGGFGSGARVLDLCAAPGGKTTDISVSLREELGGDFCLVSNEVMKQRASVLLDNVQMWGDGNVVVTSVDPAAFARLQGGFDVIVADVPCSGEGMFRKDERAVEEWSEETVQLCSARQRRIIADVWPALREGGYLIYSTCTYEQCENDGNLLWAAEELGGEIVAPENEFSEFGVRLTEAGNLLKAGDVPGEGQWVGALRKTSSCRSRMRDKEFVNGLGSLHPLRMGREEGTIKGGKFIPDPSLALDVNFDKERFPLVNLDRTLALHYLHRDSIVLPEAPTGYVIVAYEGHPLGFVNNLGRRCNNLYPHSRRILMDII